MGLTIWCGVEFEDAAMQRLIEGTRRHRLVRSASAAPSLNTVAQADAGLIGADIAFGQPDAAQCLVAPRLRWVEVTTAGYTRYDTPNFLETFRAGHSVFTTMSSVFADPCAHHALGMMLALGRALLPAYREQLEERRWQGFRGRAPSQLLTGQTLLLLGFGAIARRLVELLAPFQMKIFALRRRAYSEPGVHVIAEERLSAVLPQVHHLVNLLPENEATWNYVNARRLALIRPGAHFYNLGRGPTVDQRALQEALENGRLGAAYLDVTAPEPLPSSHPLWKTKNCYITPHIAGGRPNGDEAIVTHFLTNLAAFEAGEPMIDRVV